MCGGARGSGGGGRPDRFRMGTTVIGSGTRNLLLSYTTGSKKKNNQKSRSMTLKQTNIKGGAKLKTVKGTSVHYGSRSKYLRVERNGKWYTATNKKDNARLYKMFGVQSKTSKSGAINPNRIKVRPSNNPKGGPSVARQKAPVKNWGKYPARKINRKPKS